MHDNVHIDIEVQSGMTAAEKEKLDGIFHDVLGQYGVEYFEGDKQFYIPIWRTSEGEVVRGDIYENPQDAIDVLIARLSECHESDMWHAFEIHRASEHMLTVMPGDPVDALQNIERYDY